MHDDDKHVVAMQRSVFGKKSRFLRREGWVPANVYGRRMDSIPIQVRGREMEWVLAHVPRTALLSLAIDDGERRTVLVRTIDRRPTTGELYHVDFLNVSMEERIRAEVPLVFHGEAPAAKMFSATILHALSTLRVEVLAKELPTAIEVDLERLAEVDDAVHIRDLAVPEGVNLLEDPDELVVKALAPAVEEAAAPKAVEETLPAPAEPAETREAPAEDR